MSRQPLTPFLATRWIARSCLQKAIRRGEVQIAQRALATLLEQDRYGIWRHLIIIALEDVGVPGMDLIAQVAAAGRDRTWRKCHGGEWAVASFLAQRMAKSVHCQAVCDLLLRATNCSVFDKARADALDAEAMDLMAQLIDDDRGLVGRALTALAWGGGLAEGQRHHETAGVLDALAGKGFSSEVLATSQAAWRISRNPMALLLPLVWQRWATTDKHDVRDDEIAPAVMLGCVPDYAIDQFTRLGGAGRQRLSENKCGDGQPT